MSLTMTLFLSTLLCWLLAGFHLLRARFAVADTAAHETASAPAGGLTVVDEDPRRVRARILRALDRSCALLLSTAGLLLLLPAWLLADTQPPLPAAYALAVLAMVYLIGWGLRYLIGVKYVHRVRDMLERRYHEQWRPAARAALLDDTSLATLGAQLRGLLDGYLSAAELAYLVDSYRLRLEKERGTPGAERRGEP